MTPKEAALLLGTDEATVRALQKAGTMPNPIPDDHPVLEAVAAFRIRMEVTHREKVDRQRAEDAEHG